MCAHIHVSYWVLVNLVLGSIAFETNASYKHSVNARFFVRDIDIKSDVKLIEEKVYQSR